MFYKKLYIINYTTFFSIFQSFARIFTKENIARIFTKEKAISLKHKRYGFYVQF